MKLYTNPNSPNGRKVAIVAQMLGIDTEQVVLNPIQGETRKPEFLAINPNGKVPALVDGDTTLWESNTIMAYLASKKDNDLWPKSVDRYHILKWMNWEAAHFAPACGTLIFERLLKGMMDLGEPNAAAVAQAEENFKRYAAVLNGSLEGKKFLVGDNLTLADLSLGVWLAYAGPARYPVDNFKEIQRWNQTLGEVPAFRDNLPKLG